MVEVDGGQHSPDRDAARNAAIAASGWRVLRYWNDEVINNLPGVLADIGRVLSGRMGKVSPPP